ncbi:hypothetical protein [Actinoplanes sp. NBRC 103695]|uniref:hypothetical protein n=1 Tax=Actinoplanes sp. NBRC 103695 TaxID=3032202 RepID=UPI0024A06472|nr:hypothetical protein [Actinoplanes sp. NBRC 103695]GLY99033.1 hypothetical protein Acsp02_62870 [Actinoplanes sp. NBRC 103695]
MVARPAVVLRPFIGDLLAVVQPWFHHPEVSRRLGGPDWPARALDLLGAGIGEVADVVVFGAGTEPDNVASVRCATVAGLIPDTTVPDWEE